MWPTVNHMTTENDLNCNDPWYQQLERKYGYELCVEAGYFMESKPWRGSYNDIANLPELTTVIQYSGAFYPFHEGHLETIKKAIDRIVPTAETKESWDDIKAYVVIHIDNHDYRSSKGKFDEDNFKNSFKLLDTLLPYKGFHACLVFEDNMENGCSRNFTRLYQELIDRRNYVYFLCGGDRANFALTFIDDGHCIVAGRSDSPVYKIYKHKLEPNGHWFLDGNNLTSSTMIRNNIKNS